MLATLSSRTTGGVHPAVAASVFCAVPLARRIDALEELSARGVRLDTVSAQDEDDAVSKHCQIKSV